MLYVVEITLLIGTKLFIVAAGAGQHTLFGVRLIVNFVTIGKCTSKKNLAVFDTILLHLQGMNFNQHGIEKINSDFFTDSLGIILSGKQ